MRQLSGSWKMVVVTIGLLWSGFILYTALRYAFHPMLQGSISLACGLTLVYILYPATKKGASGHRPSSLDIFLIVAAIFVCAYVATHYEYFAQYKFRSMTDLTGALGLVTLLLMFEGTRRAVGKAVPILVLVFVVYGFLGPFIPGNFGHSGFSFEHLIFQLYQTTLGYWGVVTDVVTRVVVVFILFGAVMLVTGAGKAFIDLANFVAGRVRGGAAQVAVVASAMFGMFSGAAVANVATTGAFTIPTMKRAGYSPAFAGAVEAAASSGGQIMPPIMGTGAFVMAELLGIPYLHIMVAAVIPALLFYIGVAAGVFLRASKIKLGTLPPEAIPRAREVFGWQNLRAALIPLAVLVGFLVPPMAFPPQNCAAYAMVTSVVLFLVTGGRLNWTEAKQRIAVVTEAFLTGVRTLSWLVVMCVCIQTVVCVIALTGFGVKFASPLIAIGENNLLAALAVSLVATIILGMGMPTVAAYVIAVSVIGPALLHLDIAPLVAHMFVFYFAIISAITPPVAVATYPASALSGATWTSIAWIAMRLAVGAYLVPFAFVLHPALLLMSDVPDILVTSLTALVGIACLAMAGIGYCWQRTTVAERLLFLIAGILFLGFGPTAQSLIAVAVLALALVSQRFLPAIPILGRRF
jgi:TRAP transporter 4TM/12TM fusion protein